MRASTWVRLAVSGTRTDSVRFALTVFGAAVAALAWLSAATVGSVGLFGNHEFYGAELINESGLRPGVVVTMVLLTVPAMALLAQSARLGAPERDRRIAAMRLAGATPGQAVAIGAGESGAAAATGTLIGLAAYLVLRPALDHPDANGLRMLPTDLLPPIWMIVLICAALPALVTLTAARLLRRVTTSPLGVTHRSRARHAPRPWPGALIALGILAFAADGPVHKWLAHHGHPDGSRITEYALLDGALIAACVGIALSAGWIAYHAGQILHRYGRSAATQLAGARMIADPWQGSRTLGVLIIATMVGGGVAGATGYFDAEEAADRIQDAMEARLVHDPGLLGFTDEAFYTNATKLLAIGLAWAVVLAALGQLVAITEAIASRRRSYASLVATGVPRSVLIRAQMWQSLTPALPVLLIAGAVGWTLIRVFWGGTVSVVPSSFAEGNGPVYEIPGFTLHVGVPWGVLGITVGCAVGAVVLTTAISLVFLRSATSVEELRTV